MCVAIHLVLCAIHDVPYPSAAACQYMSHLSDVISFVRWPTVCVTVCLVCNWVLVLVRCPILRQQPVNVPSFVGWPIVCVMYVLCVIVSLC